MKKRIVRPINHRENMKPKALLAHFVWASLTLFVGISCGDELNPTPEPPIPPLPVRPAGIPIRITATSESVWNTNDMLLVMARTKKGGLTTRTSPLPPWSAFMLVEGADSRQALFEGTLPELADSLILYRMNERLGSIRFTNMEYRTDSLFDASAYGELVAGGCKVDTVHGTTVTMAYRTSLLDVKLTNKTGADLTILKVTMQPADPSNRPFFQRVEKCIEYTCIGNPDYPIASNESVVTYREGFVKADSLFTARIPLLLSNETAMEGKAITYSIVTPQGIYRYTQSGKTYLNGKQYEVSLTLEGE